MLLFKINEYSVDLKSIAQRPLKPGLWTIDSKSTLRGQIDKFYWQITIGFYVDTDPFSPNSVIFKRLEFIILHLEYYV